MDGDTKLLLGLLGGAALAGVAIWALQNRNNGGARAGQPALVQHNVVRDDAGRIRQVETFRGMQNTAIEPPARPQGPEPEQAMVEWTDG